MVFNNLLFPSHDLKPVYTVFWFKSGRKQEVVEDHLSLVVKQIKDYL